MNPNLLIIKKWRLNFFSNRKTTRENFKLGVNSTYILTLLFIWLLWIYYVWTLNINATKWYNIRTLELEKNSLLVQRELLEVQIAEIQSLSRLLNWEWLDIMERSRDTEYYVVKDTQTYAFR